VPHPKPLKISSSLNLFRSLIIWRKTLKKDSAVSPASAKPADLAKAQHGPGTSTSTGGATAHRNTGAATGGAVTITISGSSSTGTSTETSTDTATGAGAGKGAAKGKGKEEKGKGGAGVAPDTGDKRPHVYNITINSTGQSGHAIDGGQPKPVELTMEDIKGWSGSQMRKEMKKPGRKEQINKLLQNRKSSKPADKTK
jgi:hypothetical protein